jgi:signal transduction histidine kinase/pSer/pThr/pTyr-binding forkhead associated (FHA) protein
MGVGGVHNNLAPLTTGDRAEGKKLQYPHPVWSNPLAELVAVGGPDRGKNYTLGTQPVVLGRHSDNAVALSDPRCSRRHGELTPTPTGWQLADLGSGNGTRVNGSIITNLLLKPGDQIDIGETTLLLKDDVVEDVERTRIVMQADLGWPAPIEQTMRADDARAIFQPSSALGLLYEASTLVNSEPDVDKLLHRVLDLLLQHLPAEQGCVLLKDGGPLLPAAIRNHTGDEKLHLSRTVAEHVLHTGAGVLLHDAPEDERFRGGESIVRQQLRHILCVPLRGRHDTVGVLFLVNTRSDTGVRFVEDHLKMALAVAHQCALALEENRYYQALIQSERLAAVGQTLAGLSHHIKNVMQGVRFGSDLVRGGIDTNDPERLRKGWALVEKNQKRIDDLIFDMLNVSKDREPVLEPTSIAKLLTDVKEMLQGRAADNGVSLEITDTDLPVVAADSEAVLRALLNVVSNALDAVANTPNGMVHLAAVIDGTDVVLTVDDNGPGVPEQQRDDIFKPFISTKGSRGTGLGLPASRKTLREHGGDLTVCSSTLGGARFVFRWPRGA